MEERVTALLGVAQQKNQVQWDRAASPKDGEGPEEGPGLVGNHCAY